MVNSQGYGTPLGMLISWDEDIAQSMGNAALPQLMPMPLRRSNYFDPPWQPHPLDITVRVGLPMVYMRYGDAPFGIPGLIPTFRNQTLELLSTDCEVGSDTFGEAAVIIKSDIILARVDGHDLDIEHVEAIVAFCNAELCNLVRYGKISEVDIEDEVESVQDSDAHDEEKQKKEKKQEPAIMKALAEADVEKLTPTNFVTFFEKYRAEQVAAGKEQWKTVGCPVKIGPPTCKACAAGNKTLSLCGRCKQVQYCSKECQKGDWTEHRRICKAAKSAKERSKGAGKL